MNLDFNEIFKISIFFMKLNRTHPDIPRDKKWLLQFIPMQGLFTFIFVLILYSTIFHDMKNNDFSKSCANGTIAIFYIVVTFKYCMMLWHQQLLKRLIKTMKSDFALANLSVEERMIVLRYANKGKWVTKLWLVVATCTAGLFPFKSMILMLYTAVMDQFKLIPVLELIYPSIYEEVKNRVAPFVLMYIIMTFYATYAACMYIGLVPLGPIFMLHACGQLELVKMRILKLFPKDSYSPEKTREDFKVIVIKLEKIYMFVEDIKKTFQIIYELTLKGTIITIPFSLYQVTESYNKGQLSLEFITVIFACMTLTSCPCYYSDLLLETGESVRQSVYTSGWEMHYDKRARTILLMLLARTARPVAIKAMFRTVCLDALTDVYQQAYRIFNVLNAIWQ